MNPLTFVQVWMAIRPFARLKERREARRAAAAGAPIVTAPEPIIEHEPEHVEKVINAAAFLRGSATSKLMWLAALQCIYGIAQLWIEGTLTRDSVEPIVIGLFTAAFRIYTGGTLTEKGAA